MFDLSKLFDKLVLILQLRFAHHIANRELKRAKAFNVRDVDVQETFKRGTQTNISILASVLLQYFYQAAAQNLEHTFRNVDAVFALQKF